jgi:hypothetical protein
MQGIDIIRKAPSGNCGLLTIKPYPMKILGENNG